MAVFVVVVAAASGAAPRQQRAADPGPQPSPEAAFAAYLRVLEAGVRDPELGLYTAATRDLLRTRAVSSAQQRHELAAIRAMYATRTVREQGNLAVVRFESRQVPPYFLRRERDGWTIDLAEASRVIRFDQRNEWVVVDKATEFAFGF